MGIRPHIALVAIALISGGCFGGGPPEDTQEEVKPPDPVNDPGRPGKELQVLIDAGLSTGPEEEIPEALVGLRKPETLESQTVPSEYYDGMNDEVYTMSYVGLVVKSRDVFTGMTPDPEAEEGEEAKLVPCCPKRRIESIIVSDGAYRTKQEVQVGMTRSEIIDKLGEPSQTRGTTLIYDLGDGHKWYIRLQGPKVNAMQWEFEPNFGVEEDGSEE